jgi:hypothetical protein
MESMAVRVGTRVRVRSDYKEPSRQGSVGTIQKRHGTPDYTVFEVLFPDGQTGLFWVEKHQKCCVAAPSGAAFRGRLKFFVELTR